MKFYVETCLILKLSLSLQTFSEGYYIHLIVLDVRDTVIRERPCSGRAHFLVGEMVWREPDTLLLER